MDQIIVVGFFVILATVIVRMIAYGGVAGMLVGARTEEELGRIEAQAAGHRRVSLGVKRLDGERPIGIAFTGRAFASVERMAGSLSEADARRLAQALELAADESDGP